MSYKYIDPYTGWTTVNKPPGVLSSFSRSVLPAKHMAPLRPALVSVPVWNSWNPWATVTHWPITYSYSGYAAPGVYWW